MIVRPREAIAVASVLLAGLCLLAVAVRADPNALWNIVHGECVPGELQRGDPWRCAKVDLTGGEAHGFAVLKDIKGPAQYLLIPTRRLSGIESAALLSPDATNYFAAAWRERDRVAWALLRPMPRDALSLAVNSEIGRTQNQLHIHIDCIRADVRDALERARSAVGRHWALLSAPLAGRHYRAMRVDGDTLDGNDPFKLLAQGVPGAAADMGRHTLVVAGMWFDDGAPGFVILDDRVDILRGDFANGEKLQDHSCALRS